MAFNHPTELGIGHIHNENGTDIATAFLADNEENKKSLEFMLMAVNNHDALVSALQGMVSTWENGGMEIYPIGAARSALMAIKQ